MEVADLKPLLNKAYIEHIVLTVLQTCMLSLLILYKCVICSIVSSQGGRRNRPGEVVDMLENPLDQGKVICFVLWYLWLAIRTVSYVIVVVVVV